LNTIFYGLRGGCAWRLLPHEFFLPWQSAYHYYFRAWITRNRRMSRDYEFLAETTEALLYLSMISG
jgi:hypothetical protein